MTPLEMQMSHPLVRNLLCRPETPASRESMRAEEYSTYHLHPCRPNPPRLNCLRLREFPENLENPGCQVFQPHPPRLRAPSPHLRHRYRQIQTLKRPLHQQGRCSRYCPYFPCCRYSLSPQQAHLLRAPHLAHPHHPTPEALHLLPPRLFQESLECLEFLEGQQTPPIRPAHPPHLTHK